VDSLSYVWLNHIKAAVVSLSKKDYAHLSVLIQRDLTIFTSSYYTTDYVLYDFFNLSIITYLYPDYTSLKY